MSAPGRLALLLLCCATATCGESSISIRVVFPDAASRQSSKKLTLYAVEASDGWTCAKVLVQEPTSKLTEVALDLQQEDLVLPSLPMQDMLLAALAYDAANKLILTGCEEVKASPGDSLEVVIYLGCASGDDSCVDADGDGVTADKDCDDKDPCRSPALKEARNLCQVSASEWDTASTVTCRVKLALTGKPFSPPFCDDKIDQDCDGSDMVCFPDHDCDQYKPPEDCDDKDPKINPQATEDCDGKDNNCDGQKDEGCLPCDIDGDQHAGVGYPGPCNYPADDTDDFDAGIHPDTTKADNGLEGGTVLGALREYCSSQPEKNGTLAMRDVDHDGDGKTAAQDGCPSVTCDADGDGFQGAQCNPSPSVKDCNDNDPHVFPGAPDLCGDGIAQNCIADGGCSCDSDGDKYCPPADCNDNNKAIRPWAVEICDRIDNDCDQLVDEGNPDVGGNPMHTDRKLCTDDNDGKCAPACTSGLNCHASGIELSGVCACSPVDTTKVYQHDPGGNRVKCTGESLTAPASPRCFDAKQPIKEKCDQLDWNCDGKAFAAGDAFSEQGQACGMATGSCTTGTVSGCDLSQTLSPEQAEVLGSSYDQHWICTDPTTKQVVKLPTAEVCNGLDDDCDGAPPGLRWPEVGWPEVNEWDTDGDGYLQCSPCSGTLASGLKGCGDCDDSPSGAAVFPGQFEKCDNFDNNCKSGDDGLDECTGSWICCVSQKACRQLGSDFQNCGTCGKVCPTTTTDSCTGGNCSCGGSPPCAGNLNCSGGSCKCIQNGLCSGCCSINSCMPGNTTTACGTNGELCNTCTASDPCKNPVCSGGNCSETNKSDNTPCPGGTCMNGNCCTGCSMGSVCYTTSTSAHCGTGGATCDVCSSGQTCVGGNCVCNVSSCSGCCDGTTCRSGTTSTYCGVGGGSCYSCSSGQDCVGGNCVCSSSSCSGCCDGTTCRAGNTEQYCGSAGVTCNTCSSGQICIGGNCVCNTSSCSGCCDGNTCRPGTSDQYCGIGGENCMNCTAGMYCDNGTCQPI